MGEPFFINKVVLITGGTKGFGKAAAFAFATRGACVYITHKWGSVDEAKLMQEFADAQAVPPRIIQSDVADPDANRELIELIMQEKSKIDVLISNVSFAKVVGGLDDWKRQALEISIKNSAWPVVELLRLCQHIIGKYPRYVIAVSSNGPDVCYPGYGMVGSTKALVETMCRYLAVYLKEAGVRVNVIRPGFLRTESSMATFGEELLDELAQRMPAIFLDPHAVAKSCLALCSGWMDSVTGQVITVDEGSTLVGPISYATGVGLPKCFPVEAE